MSPSAQESPEDQPDQPTYEEAREELVEVVRRLEQGGGTLAEAIELWERGEHLATICQARLDGARARLDAAIAAADATGSGPGSAGDGQED